MKEWRVGKAKPEADGNAWESPFTVLESGWKAVSLRDGALEKADGIFSCYRQLDWGSCIWTGRKKCFEEMWKELGRDAAELKYMDEATKYGLVFIEVS